MKHLIVCSFLSLLAATALHAQTFSATAFSYQGRLNDAGAPATGSFDLKFELYDAETAGTLTVPAIERAGVPVATGLFTTELDFGGPEIFNGSTYWLDISVKAAGAEEYTLLTPRQKVRPVPYAIRAQYAATVADGSITSVSLAPGAVDGAAIAPGAVTLSQLSTTGAAGAGMVLGYDGHNLAWLTPGSSGGGGSLTFPFSGLGSSTGALFSVNNSGNTGEAWAIYGHSQFSNGILGQTHSEGGAGVAGRSDRAPGVDGLFGAGVFGFGANSAHGVQAISTTGYGLWAATNGPNKSSIYGQVHEPTSMAGQFNHYGGGTALMGETTGAGWGVFGRTQSGVGVRGDSFGGDGVMGFSTGAGKAGVVGINNNAQALGAVVALSSAGTAVFAKTDAQEGAAGFFWNSTGGDAIRTDGVLRVNGRVVTRVLEITGGADVAEPFSTKDGQEEMEPGSVVVISGDGTGTVELSTKACDKRVAGIVSGARGIRPGLRLRQEDAGVAGGKGGRDVALTGRVWCLCDATEAAVEPGDLLTTSETPGHAMRVTDHDAATGAVLGKAMSSLPKGERGHVLVLVSLQ